MCMRRDHFIVHGRYRTANNIRGHGHVIFPLGREVRGTRFIKISIALINEEGRICIAYRKGVWEVGTQEHIHD